MDKVKDYCTKSQNKLLTLTNSSTAGPKTKKKEFKTIYIPGFKAKLSIKLFQAMKAIFLIMGVPLRKPSSSSCNKELMKLPLRCKV